MADDHFTIRTGSPQVVFVDDDVVSIEMEIVALENAISPEKVKPPSVTPQYTEADRRLFEEAREERRKLQASIFRTKKMLVEHRRIERSLQERKLKAKVDGACDTSKIGAWAFYIMPAEKLNDQIACLEELYQSRFLPMHNFNKKCADRTMKWQVVLLVLGHYQNKVKWACLSLGTFLGLTKLVGAIKGWFAW